MKLWRFSLCHGKILRGPRIRTIANKTPPPAARASVGRNSDASVNDAQTPMRAPRELGLASSRHTCPTPAVNAKDSQMLGYAMLPKSSVVHSVAKPAAAAGATYEAQVRSSRATPSHGRKARYSPKPDKSVRYVRTTTIDGVITAIGAAMSAIPQARVSLKGTGSMPVATWLR